MDDDKFAAGIKVLADSLMRAYAAAVAAAGPDSPLREAVESFGSRHADVACGVMRERVKALFEPERAKEAFEMIAATGRLGEQAVLTELVADVVDGVVAEYRAARERERRITICIQSGCPGSVGGEHDGYCPLFHPGEDEF